MSELVAKGLNNQQVADQVYLSVHTITFHLRQTFRKLNIGSRVELTDISRPDDAAGQMSPDPGHVRKLIAD